MQYDTSIKLLALLPWYIDKRRRKKHNNPHIYFTDIDSTTKQKPIQHNNHINYMEMLFGIPRPVTPCGEVGRSSS